MCTVQVCLKGTLFTPLSQHNTSTQSLNVQLRKTLDLHVNLVHGWTMPGVPSRFQDIDIVVIRYLRFLVLCNKLTVRQTYNSIRHVISVAK
jgi:isocitrate/isopropylmalate dehydrogenase